jgi:predicted nucleotidyltransferase
MERNVAKTALELTPQEKLAYRPAEAIERRQEAIGHSIEDRWRQAQHLAQQAARALRDEFGASRVLLFGSAAQRPRFTLWSDVDLAAEGLPAERFYAAVAFVTGLSENIQIDLVDMDQCSQTLRTAIERESVEL